MQTKNKTSWNQIFRSIGWVIKLFLIVYLPIIGFALFIFGFIAIVIIDPNKDLTSLLSVSFGMLIALSSVCFSWVKTIDPSALPDDMTDENVTSENPPTLQDLESDDDIN